MSQIKVELQDSMGSDRSVANSAWTSSTDYQKKQTKTDEDVRRVVEMLASKKHSVPFESVVFKFWTRLPIAIDRQLEKHRISSQSGMSGRYRTMPSDYLEMAEDILNVYNKINSEEAKIITTKYNKFCKEANDFYNLELKAMKVAEKSGTITNDDYKRVREFLRGVLPQHNLTEKVIVINLRSFSNLMKLRLKSDAQPEIQLLANLMLSEVKNANVCPLAIEWLEKNNWEL